VGASNPTLIPGYTKGLEGPGGFYLNYGFYTNAVDPATTNYCRMKIFVKQLA